MNSSPPLQPALWKSDLSPQQAAQHLLNRRRARTDIVSYASVIDVPGRPVNDDEDCSLFHPVETNLAPHHKILLTALEETAATRYGRLMVFMPRGGGKSTYSSVVFPANYLSKVAARRILLASYGTDLAKRMGRRTRAILRQPRHQRIFDVELSGDSQAAERFSLTNGSEYMAAGLLAGIVGNRYHGALIDDPISGREAAGSKTQRDKTWEAYNDDLLPCLVPGGWLGLIMTRWNLDDIAGRILPEDWAGESGMIECRDGHIWRVLCLQAKCETATDPLGREPGEYLWPEWFDARHWKQFESNELTWNSMFQQRPQVPGGSFFRERDLLILDPVNSTEDKPAYMPVPMPRYVDAVYAVIDTAVKAGLEHDGLAVTFFVISQHGTTPFKLYVADWEYTQITADLLIVWLPQVFATLNDLAKEVCAIEGSLGAWIEDAAAGAVLLAQSERAGWRVMNKAQKQNPTAPIGFAARAIESKLTSLGKVGRSINASGPVSRQEVKFTERAFKKAVNFKGVFKNHLWGQVIGFRTGVKENIGDDCLDTFTYGVALGLGNPQGF